MDIFKDLNEKQQEAVRRTEGYVRVIAGAGSGKTKLLVSRYAYLVKDYGIDPANILCVTFTNKATSEMRSRVKVLIGEGFDTGLICTYHGFCAKLIKDSSEKLFLQENFQIIDAVQQKSILQDIYQKLELKLDYASFESTLKKIADVKSDTEYVPKLCSPEKGQVLRSVSSLDEQIIEEYMQRQKASYSLDFNDLISFAIYLLETDPGVREKWETRLNYILVDEFQDSSKREMRLLDLLSGYFKNLMIVGDPDQNIYEWRGSDVSLIVDFDKTHEGTKTIFLDRNYRSTPQILTCANTLIDKNEYRLKKNLYTKADFGAEVFHYHSKCDEDETGVLAGLVRSLSVRYSYCYSDMAVLYRTNALSRVVEKRFIEDGIPYEIYGGVKFYQRMEVQDVIAYLRVVAYKDDVSLKRIINTPRRKFGRSKMAALVKLNEIQSKAEGKKRSLYTTLKTHINDEVFKGSKAREFVQFIDAMRAMKGKSSIADIVRTATEDSGYEEYIRSLGDEERLDNLAEFKRIAMEYENSFGEDLTLQEFLQQISLQASDDKETGKDSVKLMTIHTAKGLEFPVVFITGLTEGIFPSSRTIEERKKLGLEEERRLCYVAITRAKERLFLLDSEGYSQNQLQKFPSRFLYEIGEENYARVGEISKELRREGKRYIEKLNQKMYGNALFAPGMEVEHHIFGTGRIEKVNGSGSSYLVRFEKGNIVRNISSDYFLPKDDRPSDDYTKEASDQYDQGEGAMDTSIDNKLLAEISAAPDGYEIYDEHGELDDKLLAEICEDPEGFEIYDTCPEEEEGKYINDDECDCENPGIEHSEEKTMRDLGEQAQRLRESMKNYDNLWNREDVPHDGWRCIGVTDLESLSGICEMCGHQIIRYAHHMVHDNYWQLDVGCICAGRMEGDIDAAKARENKAKSFGKRLDTFRNKKWRRSLRGNDYIQYEGHLIVLHCGRDNRWRYSIDGEYRRDGYRKKAEAKEALFRELNKLREGKIK